MRTLRQLLTLSVTSLAITLSAGKLHASELPLKNIVVTTSGLALYEHKGVIEGSDIIDLSVRLGGIDDVLKSLVILDDGGEISHVSLPGRKPLSQLFKDMPFGPQDLTSLTKLLNTLRGAEVKLDVDKIDGLLMNVAPENTSVKNGIVTKHRLSVLTKDGIKTAIIEDLSHLKFKDPELNEQLHIGLSTIFNNRIKDRRTVEISLEGKGKRNVSMAYIQEAPLWKSAYRLIVPNDDQKDETALIQGWAVLENTTGKDWNDVNVTLMSGSPVTYHQSLYESYHVSRPELPVKIMDRIMPRTDKGVIEYSKDAGYGGGSTKRDGRERKELARSMSMPKASNFGHLGAAADIAEFEESLSLAPAMPQSMAQVQTAAASETASQMVFKFPHTIDVQAGHSLMLPYAQHELPAEQLYVYQPETNATHPLASILVKNTSDSALPPGILTLYKQPEDSNMLHVGDAEMPLIPKGEDRLINFALDTNTKIDPVRSDTRQLGLIKLNKGVLTQEVVYENTTTYTIKAPAEESRTILLEHPRMHDWELVGEYKGKDDKTLTHHRVKVPVKAGESKKVPLTLRHKGQETVSLVNISPADITARLRVTGKALSPKVKNALKTIQKMRQDISNDEYALNRLRQDRNRIHQDQNRIRENLKSVSQNSAIGKRYLNNLDKQETELEALLNKEENLQKDLNKKRNELSQYVNSLTL